MNKKEIFKDKRGTIEILEKNLTIDLLRIKSKINTKRAAHYHKTSGHWCIVTSGEIQYYERPVGKNIKPRYTLYERGDMFWTGPMIEHLMVFPNYNDNEFICLSTGKRTQKEYEKDLVRINYDLAKLYSKWKD
mgnify:CR=1 FL=1